MDLEKGADMKIITGQGKKLIEDLKKKIFGIWKKFKNNDIFCLANLFNPLSRKSDLLNLLAP